MRRSAFALAMASCVLATSVPGRARPSLWELAAEPSRGIADRALRAALRARHPREMPPEIAPAFGSLLSLHAATLIELAGGAALPSPEVRLLLADSLIDAEAGREREALSIIRAELARHPDHPMAARVWFSAAIAADRLGDFEAAIDAYDHALALEHSRELRARILMNRAEEKMGLGRLGAAEHDYERALESSSDAELYALANWGKAVAFARENELPRALESVRKAISVVFRDVDGKPIFAIELPSVFYTPDYEINYYRALAFMARAEDAAELDQVVPALEQALSAWRRYLERARATNDKWIENVERYAAWCERRLAKVPRPPSERRPSRARSD